MEITPLTDSVFLKISETTPELVTGLVEGCVRINPVKPSGIDSGEHEITKFLFGAVVCRLFLVLGDSLIHGLELGLKLSLFLLDLVPDLAFLFPVEAHSTGLVLH